MLKAILGTLNLSLALFAFSGQAQTGGPAYDLLIVNGSVINGSGGPAIEADVLVEDGMIVQVGAVDASQIDVERTIDAEGRVVSPGFIDTHSHGDPLETLLPPNGQPANAHISLAHTHQRPCFERFTMIADNRCDQRCQGLPPETFDTDSDHRRVLPAGQGNDGVEISIQRDNRPSIAPCLDNDPLIVCRIEVNVTGVDRVETTVA